MSDPYSMIPSDDPTITMVGGVPHILVTPKGETRPLPSEVTPEMAESLLRYRTSGGALGAAIGHSLVDPFTDIYDYSSTNYPGAAEAMEPQRKAFMGLTSLLGPVGAGKGAGIAASILGGVAKKAEKPLAKIAAESFRSALPKTMPLDHTEAVLQGIREALGGDWDTVANMPKAGTDWQRFDKDLASLGEGMVAKAGKGQPPIPRSNFITEKGEWNTPSPLPLPKIAQNDVLNAKWQGDPTHPEAYSAAVFLKDKGLVPADLDFTKHYTMQHMQQLAEDHGWNPGMAHQTPTMEHLAQEFVTNNLWAKGQTPEEFAKHISDWYPENIGNVLGYGAHKPYFGSKMVLSPTVASEVAKHLSTDQLKAAKEIVSPDGVLHTPATKLPDVEPSSQVNLQYGNPAEMGKLSPDDAHLVPSNTPGDYFVVAKGKKIADLSKIGHQGYLLEMPNGASETVPSPLSGKLNALVFHNKAASAPSLADEDIDAALAKNPGMSLFDLSGIKSETLKQSPPKFIDVNPDALPRGATWQLPADKRAAASVQGYNVLVHHGTRTPTIFDEFKLPENGEIGVHFGSPRAAQEIQGGTVDWSTAPRVYPAAIVAQNPLRMSDRGTWWPGDVQRGLVQAGFPEQEVITARYKGIDTTGMTVGAKSAYLDKNLDKQAANMRDYIQSKGYDSIVYKNSVEDKGHDSYILFRESPSSPGHVYGARLPWADFDPKKFTSANIKAGIPLAGATAAYAASQDGKLRPVRDVEHSPFPGEVSQ